VSAQGGEREKNMTVEEWSRGLRRVCKKVSWNQTKQQYILRNDKIMVPQTR